MQMIGCIQTLLKLCIIIRKNKKAEFVFPDYYEVDYKGKIFSHIKRHDFKSVKLHDQPAHGACAFLGFLL